MLASLLCLQVRAEFDTFAKIGPGYCLTHTLTIMSLLMPLRRLCSGGEFTRSAITSSAVRLKNHQAMVAAQQAAAAAGAAGGAAAPPARTGPLFPAEDDIECSICMCDFEAPLCTPCGHWFCTECITAVLQQRPNCPLCRTNCKQAQLRAAVYPEPEPEAEVQPKEEDAMEGVEEEAGPSTRRARIEVQMDSKMAVRCRSFLVVTFRHCLLAWLYICTLVTSSHAPGSMCVLGRLITLIFDLLCLLW